MEPLLDALDFVAEDGLKIAFATFALAAGLWFAYLGFHFVGWMILEVKDHFWPRRRSTGRVARYFRDWEA